MELPDLSIIIAASHAHDALERCLAAVEDQTDRCAIEVCLVTDAAEDARLIREKYPRVVLIESERPRLVPELWGLAVARARGRVIALTVASFILDARWAETILRAQIDGHVAIGGAIENVPGNLVDWAVYFVRYSAFMLPFRAGPVVQIPGDNAAYLRAAIAPRMEWIAAHGFWESQVNAWLRSQGHSLWGEPRLVAHHVNSFTLGGFARQRFEHGRVFGRMRAAGCTPVQRALYIAASPAIPLIYLARVVRNVVNKKRNRLLFVLSLPLTVFFLLGWASGEFTGLTFG